MKRDKAVTFVVTQEEYMKLRAYALAQAMSNGGRVSISGIIRERLGDIFGKEQDAVSTHSKHTADPANYDFGDLGQ